jgi:hypothetical protein
MRQSQLYCQGWREYNSIIMFYISKTVVMKSMEMIFFFFFDEKYGDDLDLLIWRGLNFKQ